MRLNCTGHCGQLWRSGCVCLLLFLLQLPSAQAIPAFARQTGQNCVACHAGGQFPELTPYGRFFKLTAYTIGQRSALPVSAMVVASYSKVSNASSDSPSLDFPKDAVALFQTASLFGGGRVSDNVGVFAQATYDNYAAQDPVTLRWKGHTHADNIDLRYADHLLHGESDWIVGLSLNNNPSVSDVWNSAPAWIQYVPTNFGFTGPSAAPLVAQLGQQVAGLTVYTWWNRALYAEVGAYRAATGHLSVFATGNDLASRLSRTAPYLRLTASHEWGPQNVMIGLIGMDARISADPTTSAGPGMRYRDRGLDMQYQYLLHPHAVTGQFSFIRERVTGGDASGITALPAVELRQWRLKASYVYQAKLGAALSYFSTTGDSDGILYPGVQDDGSGTGATVPIPVSGSVLSNPDTRGWLPEVFWTPWQYTRIGLQYTRFNRYNGARSNYDGAARNARDNNTLFIYAWTAF